MLGPRRHSVTTLVLMWSPTPVSLISKQPESKADISDATTLGSVATDLESIVLAAWATVHVISHACIDFSSFL